MSLVRSSTTVTVLLLQLLVGVCRPQPDQYSRSSSSSSSSGGGATAAAAFSAPPINITVFHVNQARFGSTPLNMDTGDALGDMYFALRSRTFALECAGPPPYYTNDCVNPEVASSSLVITKLVLTVLGGPFAFGPYAHCNVCTNHTDHHGIENCTNGRCVFSADISISACCDIHT
jgi:hypothetical protein